MPSFGGFWLRFVAYIIDAFVLNIAVTIVGMATGLNMGMNLNAWDGTGFSVGSSAYGGGFLIALILSWLYFALTESSSWQATLGKRAIGLMVTDDVGRRIGFGKATGRYFAKILSAMILCIGFLMVGWTTRKQGLHDIIAGTLVYKARNAAQLDTSSVIFE